MPALGSRVALGHGDLIGRIETAALRFDDARISEAHALVSLRGDDLKLLALRGRMRVDGRMVTDVVIRSGLRVELADDVALCFEQVHLPDHVVAIGFADLPVQALSSTVSLVAGTVPAIVPGFDPSADAVLWSMGPSWRISVRGGAPTALEPGQSLDIGGLPLRVVATPLANAAPDRTRPGTASGLVLEAVSDAVRLSRGDDDAPIVIGGVPGRILHHIVRSGGVMPWRELVARVWPDDRAAETSLRRRLDTGIGRLRERLREAGAAHLAIAMDGAGTVTLTTGDADRLVVLDD